MRKNLLALLLLLGLGLMVNGQTTQILMPLGNQTSTFSTSVRGYWFTSPDCFTITGLDVPTTASTGSRNIAVIKLTAPPPAYSGTTNNFQILALYQNNTGTGIIPVNIQINQGDVIGVLGNRGNVNSYSPSPQNTTINGNTVTLTRMGMQFPLATTSPRDIWQEAGGSISRVFLYYDSVLVHNLSYTLAGNTATFSLSSDTTYTHVWDYGDGTPLDTAYNPTHAYAVSGIYNACVYLYTACGVDTVCTQVQACASPMTNFGTNNNGLTINFQDSTIGASTYLWDFGDGTTSTQQNPAHTYANIGTYTVCLITTSSCGAMDTLCQTVTACLPPAAGFQHANTTPDTVYFTNTSTSATSYFWNFGDGNTDTTQSPTHIYATPGTYTVCLTISNICGADTICQTINLCSSVPQAIFADSVDRDNGYNGIFTNNTSGGASGWFWDFGDGTTSTQQSPNHTFPQNGTYTVCLTAYNLCGDSTTYCDTIVICASPQVDFVFTVNQNTVSFTNNTQQANSYTWVFGDGVNSSDVNPIHTYNQTGTFIVCLYADNACGTASFCDTLTITIVNLQGELEGASVTVSPNPANDYANLLVSGLSTSHPLDVTLFDMSGKVVGEFRGFTGENVRMDISGVSKGMYFYRLKIRGEDAASGKLLIE